MFDKICTKCNIVYTHSYKYCPYCTQLLEEVKIDEEQYPLVKDIPQDYPGKNDLVFCGNQIMTRDERDRMYDGGVYEGCIAHEI